MKNLAKLNPILRSQMKKKSHKKIAKEWQSVQTQGPFTAQIKNTNKQHQIDKIFQYRAKKKNGGGRKNIKFTRLLSKIVAAINPSDQLTRDRWQGVKIKEKNEAERVERKQRRGEEVVGRQNEMNIRLFILWPGSRNSILSAPPGFGISRHDFSRSVSPSRAFLFLLTAKCIDNICFRSSLQPHSCQSFFCSATTTFVAGPSPPPAFISERDHGEIGKDVEIIANVVAGHVLRVESKFSCEAK